MTPQSQRREMRICLAPYDRYKSSGPYWHERTGRWHLNLLTFNGTGKHLNLAYAKYLAAVKYCRIPETGEEVDHIDGDRTNDTFPNLQIVSQTENLAKAVEDPWTQPKKKQFLYTCNNCGKSYIKTVTNAPHLYGKSRSFCSKQCSYKYRKETTVGLLFVELPPKEKPPRKNEMEPWLACSKEVSAGMLQVSSKTRIDRVATVDKIVVSSRSAGKICPQCLNHFIPGSERQIACSRECSLTSKYANRKESYLDVTKLVEAYIRIKEKKSNWSKEARSFGVSPTAIRQRLVKEDVLTLVGSAPTTSCSRNRCATDCATEC